MRRFSFFLGGGGDGGGCLTYTCVSVFSSFCDRYFFTQNKGESGPEPRLNLCISNKV